MNARARRVNLDYLESFVAAAECGSITAAARHLSLSQPTITQRLQRLEAHLGRPLMRRSAGGIALTAEGERLLPMARGLLRLDAQIAPAAGVALRLGACSNIGVFLLPDVLASFVETGADLPEVRIDSNPAVVAALDAGELDIALLEWWDERDGFEFAPWRREPLVLIVPPDDPLADRERVDLGDIRERRLLGGETGTGTGRLIQAGLKNGVSLETAMSLGSTEAVKRSVVAGLGVSLVLASCTDADERGYIVRPLRQSLVKTLMLVWRRGLDPQTPLLQHLRNAGTISDACRSETPKQRARAATR